MDAAVAPAPPRAAHLRGAEARTGLRCAYRIGGLLSVVLALAGPSVGRAAVVTHSEPFALAHTVEVTSGLVVLLGYYTNSATATASVTLPQFDPALGRLTKATVTVKTTGGTFVIAPTGVLSLLSAGAASRKLGYAFAAGATTGTGSNEVASSGGTLLTLLGLGGGDIGGAPLTSANEFTAHADLQRLTGASTFSTTFTATDKLEIFTVLSVLYGAGMKASGTYNGTLSVAYEYTPWVLSGTVYRDTDHNGFRGTGEAATGLTLHAKLLSGPSGPVVQVVPVDPVTGAYAFSASRASYRVIIDDNASAADTSPLALPAGWSVTQGAGLVRDVVLAGDLAQQDFGLAPGTGVTGKLFTDQGTGVGGVANDGVANGTEPGPGGKAVQLLDAGGSVLDAAVSLADGSFRLHVPTTVGNGAVLRVRQVDEPAVLATGGSPGTTGGTYARADRGVTFTFNGAATSGIALGTVPAPSMTLSQTAVGSPGSTLVFIHVFKAWTAGQVSFSTVHAAPAGLSWADAVHVDSNGNGRLDAGDALATGPIGVSAGQEVTVLLKVSIPQGTVPGMRLETVLRASFALANAAPPLTQLQAVSDYTLVLPSSAPPLTLTKSVNAPAASPGSTLVYTITFTNPGTVAVTNLVVSDLTPAYTTYLSSSTVSVPASLGTATVSAPAIGASGPIHWAFSGVLAPNASGSVEFRVLLAN